MRTGEEECEQRKEHKQIAGYEAMPTIEASSE